MAHKEFVTALVQEAGAVLRERFSRGAAYSEKERYHLVSDVDEEVERLITDRISAAFPEDGIIGEESRRDQPEARRVWLVDPLDGTANFVFGVPYFAVSIALEDNGHIITGAVFNPMTDELYYSERGVSTLNEEQIHCSSRESLAECLVSAGLSMIPGNVRRMLDEWRPVFESQRKGLALLSPALNICNVARGRTDAFLDFGSEMTGHSATAFILQNAGGSVSNYDLTPWDHRSKGIIACNGRLHGQLAQIAREHAARVDGEIRDADDVLTMLDDFFRGEGKWWDGFYTDREKRVPFFVNAPDESLVSHFETGRMQPGRVLELGCGPGRNAIFLASQGCEVDAVDVSAEAIRWGEERARDAGLKIHFCCESIFDLELEESAYDIVYDAGCFHHIAPHRRMTYVELVRHALKQSGVFGLTCFRPEGGSGLSDWEVYRQGTLRGGLGYTEERLRAIFEDSFEILELRQMREMDADGPHFGKAFLWAALMRPRR